MLSKKFQILAGIICCLVFCAVSVSAQTTNTNVNISNSSDINNLPVANNDQEYKIYCDITSLECQQTLIDKGLEFLSHNRSSRLCFPLYQKMVTAAIHLQKYDQAFEFGRKALTEFPDHIFVMTQLSTLASNQALMGEFKYFGEGEGYARNAVSMINSGKVPQGYLADFWQSYKKGLLGDLNQALGIFALLNSCSDDAAHNLAAATEFHPFEPYTYFLLAKAQVQLYQAGVRTPVVAPNATTKPASLAEQITTTYAHALVLTDAEKYKPLRAAIDYDIDILSKVLPAMKSNMAQSVEAARNEMNALANPPAAAVTK